MPPHLEDVDKWSDIPCFTEHITPAACPALLDSNDDRLSRYNKWLWSPDSVSLRNPSSYERLQFLQEIQADSLFKDMQDFVTVLAQVKKISLDEFIGILLLPNVSLYFATDWKKPHWKFGISKKSPNLDPDAPIIILLATQTYNFLSCYGLQRDSWALYVMPFDTLTWILIGVGIIVLGFLIEFPASSWTNTCSTIINLGAAPIEISVFSGKAPHWFSTCLIWLWVGSAIILTNLYKTVFTSDVTLPYATYANWSTLHK